MLSSQVEDLECPVCYMRFQNSSQGKPYILTSCGHSVCELCLKQTMTSQISEQSFNVSCPICRGATKYSSIPKIEDFKINYSLLEAIDSISKLKTVIKELKGNICPIHNNTLNIMCLDPKCANETLNCFRCTVSHHHSCEENFQLELADVKTKIKFEPYSINIELFETKISSYIEMYKQVVMEKIDTLFRNFILTVKNKICPLTIEDLVKNKGHYKIEIVKFELNTNLLIAPDKIGQDTKSTLKQKKKSKKEKARLDADLLTGSMEFMNLRPELHKTDVKEVESRSILKICAQNKSKVEEMLKMEKLSNMIWIGFQNENFSEVSSILKEYLSHFDD